VKIAYSLLTPLIVAPQLICSDLICAAPLAPPKAGLKDVLCQLLQISSESAGGLFIPLSRRGAPRRLRRLRGVELPVALFDAAGPLVPRNGAADMVRASSLACSGDFLLRLAICQSKHLFAKGG
jgi:hypothetical protein